VSSGSEPRRHSTGPVVHALTRVFNPIAALVAGSRYVPFYALLRHRGRRSGRWYATPVVARPIAGGLVLPLAFGVEADWSRNIRAAGDCIVRWRGAEHPMVDPRIISIDEARTAFSQLERVALRALRIRSFVRLSYRAEAATAER
jgi:deazaflavin-dependent oxidoreductase (nitroreductase family)